MFRILVVLYITIYIYIYLWSYPDQAYGGNMSTLTQKLARLGSSGKFPNNVERDLFRLLKLPVFPYYVKLPTRSSSNRSDLELREIPLLLPHQVYHFLFEPVLNLISVFVCFALFFFDKVVCFKAIGTTLPPHLKVRTVGKWRWTKPRSTNIGNTVLQQDGWTQGILVVGVLTWLGYMGTMLSTTKQERNCYLFVGTAFCKSLHVSFLFSRVCDFVWLISNFPLHKQVVYVNFKIWVSLPDRVCMPRTWFSTFPDLCSTLLLASAGLHTAQDLRSNHMEFEGCLTKLPQNRGRLSSTPALFILFWFYQSQSLSASSGSSNRGSSYQRLWRKQVTMFACCTGWKANCRLGGWKIKLPSPFVFFAKCT